MKKHLWLLVADYLRPGFTKYLLNEQGEGNWPWRPFLHHITAPEDHPHDHPGDMTITIVRGEGYIEEVFVETRTGLRSVGMVRRYLGDRFEIKAERIHRIVEVYGDVWTFGEQQPDRRPWKVFA